jgi:phage-related tail protein
VSHASFKLNRITANCLLCCTQSTCADATKQQLTKQTLSVPDALVVVMTEYQHDRELQLHACKALHKLASYSEANNSALGIAGACDAVVDVLAQDTSDAQVCVSAITAVCALAENTVNKSKLRVANAAETIQIVLDRHSSSSDSGALVQLAQAALQLLQLHSTAQDTSSGSSSSSKLLYSASPLSLEGKPTAKC